MNSQKEKKGMTPYTPQYTYKITRRLYYLLRHHGDRIIYKKLRGGLSGYYEPGTEEIAIDYRGDIIPTLIHEALHYWHPTKSETWVRREESKIINSLTSRQIKNVIRIISENLQ